MQVRLARRSAARDQDRRGAALVEAALVLPIFFMVVLGIIEFGRAMMVGQMVTNAAREAARQAILDGATNAEVEDFIYTFLEESLDLARADCPAPTIEIEPAPGNDTVGNEVGNAQTKDLIRIIVEVPFNEVTWLTPTKYLDGANIRAQASMRHE